MTFNGVAKARNVVTGAQVVTPNDTWVINQTPEHTATLFACHPPGLHEVPPSSSSPSLAGT